MSRSLLANLKLMENIMKQLTRIVLVVAAIAMFLTGFQAKPNARLNVAGGSGGTGDVIIISG